MGRKSSTSRVDQPLMEIEEDLEFARYSGPGTMIYPSPRPEVRDLVLPPMVWVQIDPVYKSSGNFIRDRKANVFEYRKSQGSPENIDLAVSPSIDASLEPAQRELVRVIALFPGDILKPEYVDAISIATHIDQSTGFPKKDSLVTASYLRERHRPFLMAIQDVESRHQKRPFVLDLVKKQLDTISTLPGK